MGSTLLEIRDLRTHFVTDQGEIPAVDGMDLLIHKGEIVGVVGESGCGKSVTSLSVMRLIPQPPGKYAGGSILFKGEDLVQAKEKRMKQIRGDEISMIFQEPMTSLNPLLTIGDQIVETLRVHRSMSRKEAYSQALEMLKKVGIARAETILRGYPHQLSGGMRQRVMIAIALCCEPELLIADEPTTALDVTIQAQILDLMKKLNEETGTAIMMITHDLGVVAEVCHRVVVMYAGKVVEEGTVREIFEKPRHPYTQGLIRSIPKIEEDVKRLYSIPGNVPKPGTVKEGCRFAARCEHVMDKCLRHLPELVSTTSPGHRSRCWLNAIEEVAN
ncbi:peptide/nickel transport system ATP-binding protein [Paenibacillus sp. RU4T]|uniref:ABC transporter ATP-binding protein n=1 Tax=unclassified Paenibacillus TaxID=185978 RepID=UPI0009565D22|nr:MULTISPECIES: ABC transporter ATP-binding protein [unclassified Paenibacillus]SIR63618.1 peptide/nickel transport system ATP-binding protein [Paenibacillus sp. RU4X]SIR71904.1 peptide/nickel transport system ATP-binding protein [Paenibacillus sp. RU4T]